MKPYRLPSDMHLSHCNNIERYYYNDDGHISHKIRVPTDEQTDRLGREHEMVEIVGVQQSAGL